MTLFSDEELGRVNRSTAVEMIRATLDQVVRLEAQLYPIPGRPKRQQVDAVSAILERRIDEAAAAGDLPALKVALSERLDLARQRVAAIQPKETA